jgi:hypothetical protein
MISFQTNMWSAASTFRQERRRNPVQRSHDTTQQHRSPSCCGCERQRITMYTPFGNIDAAHAMYGRAVLPCSELATRNQIP